MTITRSKSLPSYALVAAGLFIIIVAVVASVAWAQSNEEILTIDRPVDHDVYAARREIKVLATIDGDLVAAGQRITVEGEVTGDIIAAGQDISINSAVRDDVRAAGQLVHIAGPVSGHVVATGQTVKVEQQVGDWAWLSGQFVEVRGNIDGELKIAGKEIFIDSEVDGNVELIGETLSLGPNAIVRGNLTWYSDNQASIDPAATVEGSVVNEPLPKGVDDSRGRSAARGLMFTLSVVVSVVALYLLFPNWLRASAHRVASSPGKSLAVGFALFVSTPVLAVLLLVTRVGAWLGLGLLGVYVVLLLIGVLTGLFAASDWSLRRFLPEPATGQVLAAILVTVLVVGLLSYVPLAGSFIVLAIWLLGIGALGLQFARIYAESRATG